MQFGKREHNFEMQWTLILPLFDRMTAKQAYQGSWVDNMLINGHTVYLSVLTSSLLAM